MKMSFATVVCWVLIGLWAVSSPALAQRKTAKECPNRSGGLAMLAAIGRASSRVSRFMALRRPACSLKYTCLEDRDLRVKLLLSTRVD